MSGRSFLILRMLLFYTDKLCLYNCCCRPYGLFFGLQVNKVSLVLDGFIALNNYWHFELFYFHILSRFLAMKKLTSPQHCILFYNNEEFNVIPLYFFSLYSAIVRSLVLLHWATWSFQKTDFDVGKIYFWKSDHVAQ